MANLTYFFETISSYPELQNEFESDIKDLLGIRRTSPKITDYAFMFSSLINGITKSTYQRKSSYQISDYFRLKLIHQLQEAVYAKLTYLKILETDKTTVHK